MKKFNIGDRVIFAKDSEPGIKVKNGDRGTIIDENYASYCVEFDRNINGHDGNWYSVKGKKDHCWWFPKCGDRLRLVAKDTQKLVVTVNGTETLARLYANNKVIKTATAKCSPADKFDFETGAKIAVERLFGKTEQADKQLKIKVGKSYYLKPYDAVKDHYWIFKQNWDEKYPVKIDKVNNCGNYRGITASGLSLWFHPDHFAKEAPQYYNGKVVCVSKKDYTAYTVGKIYEFKDGRVKIDNGKVIPRNDNDAIKTLDEWNDSSSFLAKFIPLVE